MAVMVVNALGFRSFVAVAGECHVEYVLGHYVATVHDFVSKVPVPPNVAAFCP